MAVRTPQDQEDHDSLVKKAIQFLKGEGHAILEVDHVKGYNQPLEIRGSRPDIHSVSFSQHHITEVETGISLDREDTKQQFRDFSQSGMIFSVAVPASHVWKAGQIKMESGMRIARIIPLY